MSCSWTHSNTFLCTLLFHCFPVRSSDKEDKEERERFTDDIYIYKERQTDKQTDRQTDRQTDNRQTHRHTDRDRGRYREGGGGGREGERYRGRKDGIQDSRLKWFI